MSSQVIYFVHSFVQDYLSPFHTSILQSLQSTIDAPPAQILLLQHTNTSGYLCRPKETNKEIFAGNRPPTGLPEDPRPDRLETTRDRLLLPVDECHRQGTASPDRLAPGRSSTHLLSTMDWQRQRLLCS